MLVYERLVVAYLGNTCTPATSPQYWGILEFLISTRIKKLICSVILYLIVSNGCGRPPPHLVAAIVTLAEIALIIEA